jgi:hypothetical protein
MIAGRTYTVVSQTGSSSGAFAIKWDGNGLWEFCIRQQPTGSTCAVEPASLAPNATDWVFLTGIYDSSAHQVRLLIQGALTPVAVQTVGTPPGDLSSSGALDVGSDEVNGQSYRQWDGLIDDVSIFPGVVDALQLSNLSSVIAP